MPNFILTHGPVGEFTQERLLECSHRLMVSLPKEVRWRQAWYLPETDMLVCHWEAPNCDSVMQMFETAGLAEIFPIKSVQEAVEVPPEWLALKRPRGRPRKIRR